MTKIRSNQIFDNVRIIMHHPMLERDADKFPLKYVPDFHFIEYYDDLVSGDYVFSWWYDTIHEAYPKVFIEDKYLPMK